MSGNISSTAHVENGVQISTHSIVDGGVKISTGVKIFHHTVIRENVEIGERTVVGHCVVIERDTKIGCDCTIQSNTHITGEAIIGDRVFIGPGVTTSNEKNIANQGRTTPKIRGPIIGNGVRIGAGCLIAPGVRIGANAFIQAGTFVVEDVPAGEVWGGRGRAKKIRNVPESEWL
jgi:acetyltransferase-like isoleucine patch superfamily enzyme